MHTNFSTKENAKMKMALWPLMKLAKKLVRKVDEHLAVYGDDYESRLTGAHETCSFNGFRYGTADRTASIRIPRNVASELKGYLEDRRPNANADPYQVASRMLKTVCKID